MDSETIRPVTPVLDTTGIYRDVKEFRRSPHCILYTAVKAGKRFVLKTTAENSGRSSDMLKREYELSLTLSHPGMAYVFTYDENSPVGPCIVMEFIDSVPLDEWLAQDPTLPSRKRMWLQLLDVVEYIHSRGIIHNDLAPQNILISRSDGRVKLIDFGYSDDDVHYMDTNLGCSMAYASPELVTGRRVTAASDIWSLGVLMRDIFGKNRYRCVSSRCLRDNPMRRYSSVQELRRAFNRRVSTPRTLFFTTLFFAVTALVIFLSWKLSDQNSQLGSQQIMISSQQSMLESQKRQIEAQDMQLAIQDSLISDIQSQERGRMEQDAEQDSLYISYKERINDWYSAYMPKMREDLRACTNSADSNSVFSNTLDRYSSFNLELLEKCPEDIRAKIVEYLAFKFNQEFFP